MPNAVRGSLRLAASVIININNNTIYRLIINECTYIQGCNHLGLE